MVGDRRRLDMKRTAKSEAKLARPKKLEKTLLLGLMGHSVLAALAACTMSTEESTEDWIEADEIGQSSEAASDGTKICEVNNKGKCVHVKDQVCPNANNSCQMKNDICACFPN
jgi:hypothetical protein